MSSIINIEVVYPAKGKTWFKSISLPEGSSLRQAIIQSEIIQHITNFSWETLSVGIFSQRATLTTKLKAGDRVEIYRPLLRSPHIIRQERAKIS